MSIVSQPGEIVESLAPVVSVSSEPDRPDASKPPRRPRGKAQIQQGRDDIREKTQREVERIAAEFHARLPRSEATAIGVVYCRYSTRYQDSVGDQVRTILQDAERRGIFVPTEHICYDLAVKGYKNNRAGLNQLRKILKRRAAGIAMFFATNRLHRKIHRSLQFVEEKLVERGIRAIFVKSGVDTEDRKRWRSLLTFNATMDEFMAGTYADNVRAAHEGLLDHLYVFGTVTFGYGGEEIAGQVTRRGKPQQRLVIDAVESKVVRQIFDWYVGDHVPIDEIVQRLNSDPAVPLPPRCTTGAWNHKSLRQVLCNTRYRGLWKYGVTETVWISSKDYARQVPRDRPLKEAQIEELRIVPDELWFAAQKRLAEQGGNRGRKPKDGNRESRPKLLNGIFRCPTHGKPLYVSGPNGGLMRCPACRGVQAAERPLYSYLDRELALKLTCEKLAELLRADEELVLQIIRSCQDEALALQQPDPAQLDKLKTQQEALATRYRFAMSHVGLTEADQRDAQAVLRDLSHERTQVAAEIGMLEAAKQREVVVPAAEEVRVLLGRLGDILRKAAGNEFPEGAGLARDILHRLTGGRIDLFQCGERRSHGGWLQGRFQVPLLSVLAEQATGVPVSVSEDGIEVVIDYVRPMALDEKTERAMALYHEGLPNKQIALELGCSRSGVTQLLDRAFAARGEKRPDGRKRRWTLPRDESSTPAFQRIADQVKELMDAGVLLQEIAERLGCDRDTVTHAKDYWYESRGLTAPDGRSRRKELDRKVSHPRRRNSAPSPGDTAA
ncbi:MAG: recombinase family protein [Pirellulales bacterium]